MKTIYLLYDGEYEYRDVVRIFETREQAELYANIYGYDTDDIEESDIFCAKDDTFPINDIWWKVSVSSDELEDKDMIPSVEEYYGWEKRDMHEDLNILDSWMGYAKIITFNVMADNKQQAVIKANKRCKELQDYFKSLLEKK